MGFYYNSWLLPYHGYPWTVTAFLWCLFGTDVAVSLGYITLAPIVCSELGLFDATFYITAVSDPAELILTNSSSHADEILK